MDDVDEDLGELEQHLPASSDRRRVLERLTAPRTPADLLRGSATRGSYQLELVVCGKAKCKCARGALHGPYWYEYRWSVRTRGTNRRRSLVSRYVGKEGSPAAVAAGISPAPRARPLCGLCELPMQGSATVRVDGAEVTGHPTCIDDHVEQLEKLGPLEYATRRRVSGPSSSRRASARR